MSKEMKKCGGGIERKPIRTVRDLFNATVKEGATLTNGGFDLFTEELKKYIVTKGNKLMLWEDWYKKPHPLISKTEEIPCEVIEPKKLNP